MIEARECEMRVMGTSGDNKQIWNPDAPDEVAEVRRTFENLTKRGYAAFRVNRRGEQGERIREFDPEAASLILVPPLAGGR